MPASVKRYRTGKVMTNFSFPTNSFSLSYIMKHFLILLLLAAPAAAQSIDPIAYGQRFCALRRMDIDTDVARKAAVTYAYIANRSSLSMKDDARAATDYVFAHCAELVK
jgi:hypothetical protein